MLKRQAFASSAWIGVAVVATALIQLAQMSSWARSLDAYHVGLIAVLVLMMSFADLVTSLGISNAVIQRQDATRDELSSLYWLNVVAGVVVAAAVCATAPAVAAFFRASELTGLLALLSVSFLIASHGQVARGVLERDLRMAPVAASEIASAAAILVTSTTLIAQGLALLGVVCGYLAGSAVRTAIVAVAARGHFRPRARFSFAETRRFLSFGVLQSLDGLCSFANANIGAIVTGRVVSTVDLGGFNLANTYAVNTPARLNTVVTRVAFPTLSQVQQHPERARRIAARTIELAGILNAPLLGGLAVVAPVFVDVVFGERWTWIVPVLQVLALVGLTRALGNPMGAILMAADLMGPGLVMNVVRVICTVAATVIGAATGGMMGVAYALLLIGVIGAIVNVAFLRYFVGIGVAALVRSHVWGVLLAAPMVAVVGLAVAWSEPLAAPAVVRLIALVALGALVYGATAMLVPNVLRDLVRDALRGRRGGGPAD